MQKIGLRVDILLLMLLGFLLLPLNGYTQPAQPQPSAFSVHDAFQSNVSLDMEVYLFTSGMNPLTKEPGDMDGEGTTTKKTCGSGFIVREDGTVATNYHVVRHAIRGAATFDNKTSCEISHIKACDPEHDIAVIKLKTTSKFPAVSLGNSDELNILDKVIAVGDTACQGLAVTDGSINRLPNAEINLIRHCAPEGGGNSGGALYKGNKVIGINKQMGTGSQNFNLTIPINQLKPLLTAQYDQNLPLSKVFPLEAVSKKLQNLYATIDEVPAGTKDNPNYWTYELQVAPLEDYVISVESPEKALVIKVFDPIAQVFNPLHSLIGIAEPKKVGSNKLFISTEELQGNVIVMVTNSDSSPVSFGFQVNKINW